MIKKILVSQPKPTQPNSQYFKIEDEFGVKCDFRPFFKVEGITVEQFRLQRVNIGDYTAVVFTSRHAIDNFFKLAKETRVNIPETMKYFCTIEKIALYIQNYVPYRKRKVFFGESGKIEDLAPFMQKHSKEKFLVPLSGVHNDDIKNFMDGLNLNYKICTMYDTVSNDFTEEEKKNFDYDMLLFFSPTGVKALKKNFPDFEQGDIKIGTFGNGTADAAKEEGLALAIEAPTPKYPSMTGALRALLLDEADE